MGSPDLNRKPLLLPLRMKPDKPDFALTVFRFMNFVNMVHFSAHFFCIAGHIMTFSRKNRY
jgi:hypothetical protein